MEQIIDTVGSPPHTWRKFLYRFNMQMYLGITSTYVEKIDWNSLVKRNEQDHLHIRGENSFDI